MFMCLFLVFLCGQTVAFLVICKTDTYVGKVIILEMAGRGEVAPNPLSAIVLVL